MEPKITRGEVRVVTPKEQLALWETPGKTTGKWTNTVREATTNQRGRDNMRTNQRGRDKLLTHEVNRTST